MKSIRLTKSKFVMGQRCQKALYLKMFQPELQAPLTSIERKTLQAGNEIGDAARLAFPEGRLIETKDTEKALFQTQEAIEAGTLTASKNLYKSNHTHIGTPAKQFC